MAKLAGKANHTQIIMNAVFDESARAINTGSGTAGNKAPVYTEQQVWNAVYDNTNRLLKLS